MIVSLPVPPSIVSLTTSAGRVAAEIVSLPPSALITSVSFAPSEPVTLTSAGSPTTENEVPEPNDLNGVGAVRAVDDDRVGRPVAARRR